MGKYFVRARTKPSVDLLTLCPQLTVRKNKKKLYFPLEELRTFFQWFVTRGVHKTRRKSSKLKLFLVLF